MLEVEVRALGLEANHDSHAFPGPELEGTKKWV